jgi:DNA-binding MarR family transcriptional regulator
MQTEERQQSQSVERPEGLDGPDSPALESQIQALVTVMLRLGRIFKSQLRGYQLSVPQMGIMLYLQDQSDRGEGVHPGALADRFCLSSPAVTAVLDELVEKGYCVRTHSEKDRRKVVVRTTPDGAAILAGAQAGIVQGLRVLFDDWDSPRMDRLLAALHDLDSTAQLYLAREKA